MREFDVSDIGFKLLDMIVKDKNRNEQNLAVIPCKELWKCSKLYIICCCVQDPYIQKILESSKASTKRSNNRKGKNIKENEYYNMLS